jgi:hypothetical protein
MAMARMIRAGAMALLVLLLLLLWSSELLLLHSIHAALQLALASASPINVNITDLIKVDSNTSSINVSSINIGGINNLAAECPACICPDPQNYLYPRDPYPDYRSLFSPPINNNLNSTSSCLPAPPSAPSALAVATFVFSTWPVVKELTIGLKKLYLWYRSPSAPQPSQASEDSQAFASSTSQ